MCGIIGATAGRDIAAVLLDGLRRLEYRGYDSAGMAVLNAGGDLERVRVVGKVRDLEEVLNRAPLEGHTGIAHTRWATHGKPSSENAHPHVCDGIAVVHNGIVENHGRLRSLQQQAGYDFDSETDTEVVVHQIHLHVAAGRDLLEAVQATVSELEGAYALAVISAAEPGRLVAARSGSPLVVGIGAGEHFVASDVFALLPVTSEFIIMEEGDIADLRRDGVTIYDCSGAEVRRKTLNPGHCADDVDKGGFRHYMIKEIFAQPQAVADTLRDCIKEGRVLESQFGFESEDLLGTIAAVQIVACGTSYHAGLVARQWIESLAGIPCSVEVASEYRHRRAVILPNTLLVVISQSGETLDTLEALRRARSAGYLRTLAICNVPWSSLTREADLVFLTRAGQEIGVASTKAFTTQLTALLLLTVLLARGRGLDAAAETRLVEQIESLPGRINHVLDLDEQLAGLAQRFAQRHHALYLGRGAMLPVAMEGALKLKEISYIHAEAYPAGELKHGPLALVDTDMPVIAVAPNNDLLGKLQSNLHEVRARGGELYVFADSRCHMEADDGVHIIEIAPVDDWIAPVIYTIPLQLLAYHVAVLKGADVDQPRNLAKSVTVE